MFRRVNGALMVHLCAAKELSGEGNIRVVRSTTDHLLEVDVKALEGVLLDPRVRDRHVVVLSIAGVQRLGKSFILNYLIRYLKSEVLYTRLKRRHD